MTNYFLRSAIAAALIVHSGTYAAPANAPKKAPLAQGPAKAAAAAAAAAAEAAGVTAAEASAYGAAEAAADAAAEAAKDAAAEAAAATADSAIVPVEPVNEAAINAQLRDIVLEDAYLELMQPFKVGAGNPIPQLERMTQQPHSAGLAAAVNRSFGIPALYKVERLPAQPGKTLFRFTSPARQFDTVDKHGMSWGPLVSTMEFDADGRSMNWNGSWDALTTIKPDATTTMTGMRMTASQRRSAADIWLGSAALQIARVVVGIDNDPGTLVIDAADISSSVAEQGKLVDVAFDMRARSATAFGEQLDNLRFASRLTRVDAKAFENISFSSDRAKAMMAPGPFGRAMRDAYIVFAKSAAANGTTLHFDEISLAYKGHKVRITGKLSLAPVTDADFRNLQVFSMKVDARFDISLPMALLGEVSGAVADKQEKRNAAVGSDPAAAAQAASAHALTSMVPPPAVAEGMVAQMVSSGYAVLKDGVLSTTIEAKQGAIFINGQPIARDATASAQPRKGGKRPAGKRGKTKAGKAGK